MQQINLYLPEFRPNREPLRAVHMLWACAGLLVLLLVFTLYSSFQNRHLEEEVVRSQEATKAILQQFDALSKNKPAQTSADLDVRLEQLQANLQRHVQILAMIQHQDLGNDKGFSAQLNALAKASLSSISLETFSLQRGGNYAELSGKTSAADQIPLYLQRLRADPSFEKVAFGVLKVTREENGSALQFSLAKSQSDNAKKNGGQH
jgi:hypothetical protein